MPPSAVAQHPLDEISLGLIVQIRERLLKAQAAGTKVYRLESGDPNFSVPPHVLEAIGKAGAAGKTHYIPNSGIPELRKALAEKAVRKNGLVGTTDEDIFLTNGAMHALYVAFGALLSPGDEVILPDPMWTEVAENIRLAGGVTVGVPLRADHDFEYDTAEIEAAITPRTTAIFLNTPQNPTGAVLSEQTLREIADIAKRHDLWLISDEAYEDVIYEPHKHFSIGSFVPEHAEKTISIFSFSKSYAMSGLRTGYIVTKSPLLHDRIPKLLRCTINGVNSLAQWAALAAVTGDQSQLAEMRAEYLGPSRCAHRRVVHRSEEFARSRRAAPSTCGPTSIRRSTRASASPTLPSCRTSSPRSESEARQVSPSGRRATTRSGSRTAAPRRW